MRVFGKSNYLNNCRMAPLASLMSSVMYCFTQRVCCIISNGLRLRVLKNSRARYHCTLGRWIFSHIEANIPQLIHTAEWPDDYSKEDWENEKVAVIGSGASSIQTVPNMQVSLLIFPMQICRLIDISPAVRQTYGCICSNRCVVCCNCT